MHCKTIALPVHSITPRSRLPLVISLMAALTAALLVVTRSDQRETQSTVETAASQPRSDASRLSETGTKTEQSIQFLKPEQAEWEHYVRTNVLPGITRYITNLASRRHSPISPEELAKATITVRKIGVTSKDGQIIRGTFDIGNWRFTHEKAPEYRIVDPQGNLKKTISEINRVTLFTGTEDYDVVRLISRYDAAHAAEADGFINRTAATWANEKPLTRPEAASLAWSVLQGLGQGTSDWQLPPFALEAQGVENTSLHCWQATFIRRDIPLTGRNSYIQQHDPAAPTLVVIFSEQGKLIWCSDNTLVAPVLKK